ECAGQGAAIRVNVQRGAAAERVCIPAEEVEQDIVRGQASPEDNGVEVKTGVGGSGNVKNDFADTIAIDRQGTVWSADSSHCKHPIAECIESTVGPVDRCPGIER